MSGRKGDRINCKVTAPPPFTKTSNLEGEKKEENSLKIKFNTLLKIEFISRCFLFNKKYEKDIESWIKNETEKKKQEKSSAILIFCSLCKWNVAFCEFFFFLFCLFLQLLAKTMKMNRTCGGDVSFMI